jgi:hypothetical protein
LERKGRMKRREMRNAVRVVVVVAGNERGWNVGWGEVLMGPEEVRAEGEVEYVCVDNENEEVGDVRE